eukprot:6195134-Pleurochrysis_carterae.AAC.1
MHALPRISTLCFKNLRPLRLKQAHARCRARRGQSRFTFTSASRLRLKSSARLDLFVLWVMRMCAINWVV